jgi:hypothetical protein
MAKGLFATWNFTVHRGIMLLAVVASGIGTSSYAAQERTVTTSDTLGATARQAMSDIFQKKDATAVDRYFGESFIQHDPEHRRRSCRDEVFCRGSGEFTHR